MDADITEYTGVYSRHLMQTSHVPPLSVSASHNESDGGVRALFVRRYSTYYNLKLSLCRWEHLQNELIVQLTVDIFMPST